jgi:hypothetical protein
MIILEKWSSGKRDKSWKEIQREIAQTLTEGGHSELIPDERTVKRAWNEAFHSVESNLG